MSVSELTGLRSTLGAVLLGGIVGAFFSWTVTMQVILYLRIYPKDKRALKALVAAIWILDLLHTCMASTATWTYLIGNFGDEEIADHIPWTVAITVALTALITSLVHIFFTHRIFTLSRSNWWITLPIAGLAIARLALALVSASKMVQLGSYREFVREWGYIFTAGLSSATAVDILIAVTLIWYLNRSRTGFASMDTIIDSITLYTVESGLLTSVTTVVSLICWVSMPHNLIFLGLHFAISKLYANALLATLNARKVLRGRTQGSSDRSEHQMPVLFPENANRFSRARRYTMNAEDRTATVPKPGMIGSRLITSEPQRDIEHITTKVQISVEQIVDRDDDEMDADLSASFVPTSTATASLKASVLQEY